MPALTKAYITEIKPRVKAYNAINYVMVEGLLAAAALWRKSRNAGVGLYDELKQYDNPTVGILLCADIDADIART